MRNNDVLIIKISLALRAVLAERRPNTFKCGYIGKSVAISCYYYVLLRIGDLVAHYYSYSFRI